MMLVALVALLPLLAAAAPSREPTETVLVALHPPSETALVELLYDISDPDSANYGKHLSQAELRERVLPSEDNVRAASTWLRELGAVSVTQRTSGDYLDAVVPTGVREKLLARDAVTALAAPSVVYAVFGATNQPLIGNEPPHRNRTQSVLGQGDPNTQKKAYGVPTDLKCTNANTTQMVWGTGTYGYLPSDLKSFWSDFGIDGDLSKIHAAGDEGEPGGDNFGEASLDVTCISSMALDATTIVYNSDNASDTEWSRGFGTAQLAFAEKLSSSPTVPTVLSLSLGSLSWASCDLMCQKVAAEGHHTYDECSNYTSKQRQVCMYNSAEEVNRTSYEYMKLGLRGVSIFAATGDGGSHFSFQPFDRISPIGRALNDVACVYTLPTFPAASPYVTGVGGTQWTRGPDAPVAWHASGSGFAWEFEQPAFQASAVDNYLSTTPNLPGNSTFNTKGRAYPDVAALAEGVPMVVDGHEISAGGTSAAAPEFAGVITLINDHRLNAGKPPLGWLNPRIYKIAQEHPNEAFYDMTTGTSACTSSGFCCKTGLPAAKGWDPTTGLGSPKFAGLLEYLGSD
eukprot:m.487888 g.487888  ORF g.487888 m.487888 type:complete len:570 (-) comp25328_c0_seq1:15-1724(-)